MSAENEIAAVIADLRRHWPTQVEISVAADLLESLQSLLAKKDERLSQARALEAKLQGEINEHELEIAELRARCEAVERDAERYRWLTKLPKSKDELLAFVVFNGNPSEAIDAAIAAQYAQRKEEGKVSDCPKICLACRHFYFNGGERGYSSMTPGSDMQAYCAKQHWDAFEETAERFFEDNLRARTCPDYEVSDLAKRHGWKNPE